MAKHGVYIETSDPLSEQKARTILRQAGIAVLDVRAISANHIGIMMSDLLLQGCWNHESGYDDCEDKCRTTPAVHRGWRDLTHEQQDTFAAAMAGFMDRSRYEQFLLAESLQNQPVFQNVRLERCADDSDEPADQPTTLARA